MLIFLLLFKCSNGKSLFSLFLSSIIYKSEFFRLRLYLWIIYEPGLVKLGNSLKRIAFFSSEGQKKYVKSKSTE